MAIFAKIDVQEQDKNRQFRLLTVHKTLVTDWLAYAQNISQPSFVGSSTSSALGICLQCLCRNPALIITQVLSPLLRVYGGRRGFFVVPIPRQLYILQ